MMRQPFVLYPRATIRSIDVKFVVRSADAQWLTKLERWLHAVAIRRMEYLEAQAVIESHVQRAD